MFAFDDVMVEKTSVVSSSNFYIHWNQYYILTYLRFSCLHTLELIQISDVLKVEPIFFVVSRLFTHGRESIYV